MAEVVCLENMVDMQYWSASFFWRTSARIVRMRRFVGHAGRGGVRMLLVKKPAGIQSLKVKPTEPGPVAQTY